MKNAPKCVFELLDLIKIREIGTIFTEKGQYLKKCLYDDHTLSSKPLFSVRECSKFSENTLKPPPPPPQEAEIGTLLFFLIVPISQTVAVKSLI
jgi:hypothetical protein